MAAELASKDNTARSARQGADWGLILLLALVAVGFWIRVKGLTFGLPFNYHFDENLYAVTAQTYSLKKPHPTLGPFQLLLVLESHLLPLIRPLLADPRIAVTAGLPNMSFHLLARWTSAFFGVASLIPLYLLGREVWGRAVGLVGAAFLTFMYLHTRNSHFGVPDTMVTFLVIAAAYACVRLAATGAWRYYLLAGLMAGLAVPTKQLTWPIVLLILLFHLAAQEDRSPRRLLAALWSRKLIVAYLVALVALLVTSPQLILAPKTYYAYWKLGLALGAKGGLGRMALDPGPLWLFYLGSLRWGMGEAMLWLSLAGCLAVLVRRRPWPALLLMVYPILFFLFLCRPGNFYFARYAMTGIPLMILAGAALLVEAVNRLRAGERARTALIALATLAVVIQPAVATLRFNSIIVRKDTRTQAKEWIEANIPAGSKVTLESWVFVPQLASLTQPYPFSRRAYDLSIRGIRWGLSEPDTAGDEYEGTATVEDYQAEGAEYIVSNSFSWSSRLLDPEQDRAKRAFYADLARKAELLKEFSPYRGPIPKERPIFDEVYGPALDLAHRAYPGPVIRIYRLPPAG